MTGGVTGVEDHGTDFIGQPFVHVGRDVALAHANLKLHLEAAVLGQGGNELILIQNGDILVFLDHTCRDLALFVGLKDQTLGLVRGHCNSNLFQVQHDLGHVLKNTRYGGELMLHSFNGGQNDGTSLHGGEKHPAHSITNGSGIAAFQGFADEFTVHLGGLGIAHEFLGLDQFAPITGVDEFVAVLNKHEVPYLLGVQFDNKLLVDRELDIFPARHGLNRALEVGTIRFQPLRATAAGDDFLGFVDHGDLASFFADFNDVLGLDLHGRNVHAAAIELEDTVTDQLASLIARIGKAETIYNIVQATFEEHQQIMTCYALHAVSPMIVHAELAFENAVHTTDFLLFTQLDGVIAHLVAHSAGVSRGGKAAFRKRTYRCSSDRP